MAEHRDMTSILNNVEEDLKHNPTPARVVESFAPQRHRNAQGDNMEQIQQDFRKAAADMESRFKALMDELKRVVG